MRILLTGHDGYIGAVMAPRLLAEGFEVVGLDTGLFDGCDFGRYAPAYPRLRRDLRGIEARDLDGFDAVVHLAAISNDPLGDLNPQCTYDINHGASVRLAEAARSAGVGRYVYSSSCSVYGAADPNDILDETASFNPLTPYGRSKVMVEEDVRKLADASFSPVFMRNATAYGVSPRLRGDLVVNNLVGWAVTTGRVFIKSDGTPWRPLVHILDISDAFVAALRAPRERVHNEAFNVGNEGENYRISDIATIVERTVPGSRVEYAEDAGPDPRCYRVSFAKIAKALPEFRPRWNVERGVIELRDAFQSIGLTQADLEGDRYLRIRKIRWLLDTGKLDSDLCWVAA